MGILQRSQSLRYARQTRSGRARGRRPKWRSLRLEPFEERALLAVGPQLVAAYTSGNTILNDNQTLHIAPTELRFRFDSSIDPASLITGNVASIQVTRGGDHILGNGNDVSVAAGSIDVLTTPTDVVVRFANNLVDDVYQVRIVGSGSNPLSDTDGDAFNDGQDLVRNFTLDLGAQVVAVVPQPITRNPNGTLTQASDEIDVYFNANDALDASTATNRLNYELIRTHDVGMPPSATTTDDQLINPTSVTYDPASGKAVLTFATGVLDTAGLYRLRVGNNDPLSLAPVNLSPGTPGSSFDTAADLGTLFPAAQGTQNANVVGTIGGSPVQVVYPGDPAEPGMRELPQPLDQHLNGSADTSGVIPIITYNFKHDIGTVLGSPVFNSIDDVQKDRVREVFSYYSEFLGVEFVETPSSGWTIATGDPRAVDPNVVPTGVGGIAGGSLAVINASIDWGDSGPGGAYFETAMHEIGHLLGLGHTYELPPLAVQGGSESAADTVADAERYFPGDSDIVLGQYLHPAVGNDVRMYGFRILRAGTLNLETIAERMRQFDPTKNPSFLNSVVTVYDSTGTLIARNDDYYGNDSFLQLDLEAGNYFVAVTSTGNTNFDPAIENTGFGGTTQGSYQLRLTFTPASTVGIRDATGTQLDGNADGTPGGVHNFWFRVAGTANTIYVDKAASAVSGTLGSITNPYKTISLALAAAAPGSVVRIVGNGGSDSDLATLDNNLSYNIGHDNIGRILSDGAKFEIPKGVTVMIDAGAIIKLRGANIDAGTVVQGVDHSGGALQLLGTTARDSQGNDVGSVYITSFYDTAIGTDSNSAKDPVGAGDWGGLVFHDDSDLESDGIFLNYVNHANISYGGGRVFVFSVEQTFDPIHLVTARPTISFNTITDSANAAASADPNSFEESEFQGPLFAADYSRSGPKIYGNSLLNNSIKGLFIRVTTPVGNNLQPLTVSARWSTTDMVYVVEENLEILGQPGGYFTDADDGLTARPGARLAIDPGVIVKLGGARIETQIGGQLIAEGNEDKPVIFTSVFDDRYGAGGAFDTTNDGSDRAPDEGDWGGLYFGPLSIGSLDHVLVTFAGGAISIEGGFASFNAIEIHRAQVRVANSTIERNAAAGDDSDRAGRGPTTPAIIFIRGAQPVLVNNILQNNDTKPPEDINTPLRTTAAISINVNALNAKWVTDWGRSTGLADVQYTSLTNSGPLVRGNRIGNTPVNGMVVRGGRLTTDVVMDDTDIVHVVLDEIVADTQFSLAGRVRLQSTSTESLVLKLLGTDAGFTAAGVPLDIDDRIGGSVQIVGMPNHPVIMTSLFDDTVGAGFQPDGTAQNDTHNIEGSSNPEPPPSTSGPIFIDGGDRDDHGSFSQDDGNQDGWKFIEQAVDFAYTESFNTTATGILAIGIEDENAEPDSQARDAVVSAVSALGIDPTMDLTFITGNQINNVDFDDYRMIYVPSNAFNTQGGITEDDLSRLAQRKLAIQNYVNVTGGGLVALTEAFSENPYSWLELPDPFSIQLGGGVDLVQTPLLAAAGFDITDEELTNGTPWHNSFVGPPGFNRLQVWVVDPFDGQIVTLGSGAGQGGIGVRLTDPQAGDWRSIKLDDFSNDRNVDLLNEVEQQFSPNGDTNGLPTTAQFLGELAADEKSGDDIRRLGYEIHGSISQTTNSPKGGDVDVYSFRGTAGSVVWFDIDRTAQGLDTVVELVDGNGAVVARSDNSVAEQANPNLLAGIAEPMRAGFNGGGPFTNADFYSTNPKDAGMRLILPGVEGSANTYFIRVRAASSNLGSLTGGLSTGEYVLQIRLQNQDEFPGSIVRNADIRYAGTGIEVIGKPAHSPLLGDTASSSLPHDTFETAQDIGNLLTTDRNEITIAGNIATKNDVQWFKMDLNYDLIQSIGGYSNGAKTFAAMFGIEYTDGLARPDTTISVFDQNGNLLLIGRDSNVPDTQPRPSTGSDTSNTSHGSFGVLDGTIGSVQLPAGGPQPGTGPTPVGGTGGRTYYIAVSSSATLPTILDATFQQDATDPQVRLEPIDSTKRIIDDRIGDPSGAEGITTEAGAAQAFPGSTPIDLNVSAEPYTLADVVLFANTFDDLVTINPFTGQFQTSVTNLNNAGDYLANAAPGVAISYYDMVVRDDGRLYTYPHGGGGLNNPDTHGSYTQFDPSTGQTMDIQSFAMQTYEVDPMNPVNMDGTNNFVAVTQDPGVQFNAMAISRTTNLLDPTNGVRFAGRSLYVVGDRAQGNLITQSQNLLFQLNADTGEPFGNDLITDDTFFPRPDNVSYTAWQPWANDPTGQYPTGILGGSGTLAVPQGVLRTGVFLNTVDATNTDPAAFYVDDINTIPIDRFDLNDGESFTIPGDPGLLGTQPSNIPVVFEGGWELRLKDAAAASVIQDGTTFMISGTTFEFDSDGTFNGANEQVVYSPGDTTPALLTSMTNAVNAANVVGTNGDIVEASTARDRIMFLHTTNNTTNLNAIDNLSSNFIVSGQSTQQQLETIQIEFKATDSAALLAQKIRDAISQGYATGSPADPFRPIPVPDWGIDTQAYLTRSTTVKLNANEFQMTTSGGFLGLDQTPFGSDAVDPLDNSAGFFFVQGDVTGIALLPSPSSGFTSDMYAVSDTGGVYRVTFDFNAADKGVFNSSVRSLDLLNLVTKPNGDPVHFTGLTEGPSNVEGGRYARTLFASDIEGNLYAFDDQGQAAPVFVNGATQVDTLIDGTTNNAATFGGLQGLGFSTLDYNLWHVTSTRGGPSDFNQHGVTQSIDYNAARLGTSFGGNSFYFGLEETGGSSGQQPNAIAYQPFADEPLLSGNRALYNSYNLPGGAHGTLMSAPFSLEGYSATDKPTLYFNYAADTEGANSRTSSMLDSFRVYASSDGVNWFQLATNNSERSSTFSTSTELPTYISDSGGLYQGDKSNQRVQELFDPEGGDPRVVYPTNDFDQPLPSSVHSEDLTGDGTLTPVWRQARVDLGDLAGQSNIRLRFDFSSAGTMGTGDLLQGGAYLSTVDASKLQDGDTFNVGNVPFTLREGLSLVAPVGGGLAISSGETFMLGPTTFEFTRTGGVTAGNVGVLIDDSFSAEQVADAIFLSIFNNPVAGVTPVRDSGYSLSVPLNGGAAIVNGETFTINDTTFEVRSNGGFTAGNFRVPVNVAYSLTVPAGGGAALNDGEFVVVNGTFFRLSKSGIPGAIPYSTSWTQQQVTDALAAAITAADNRVTAVQFGNSLVLMGATSVSQSIASTITVTQNPEGNQWSAQTIADVLAQAITLAGNGVTPLQTGVNLQLLGAGTASQSIAHSLLLAHQSDGARVQLVGATSVSQSASPALIVEGSPLPGSPATTDVFYQVNWSAEQVAQAVAAALDATFTVSGNTDMASVFTTSKVNGAVLNVFGHSVGASGPFSASSSLQGDQFGTAYSPFNGSSVSALGARNQGRDNAHEGVYIDDVIVGFAARGEMVTGHFDNGTTTPGVNTFTPVPEDPDYTDPQKVQKGNYQLHIRRGNEYAATFGGNTPYIGLYDTFDVNDRMSQGFTLIALPASQLVDGQTFAIQNLYTTVMFEFDMGDGVAAGHRAVLLSTDDSAQTVALKIADAINAVPVTEKFNVKAGVKPNGTRVNLFGGSLVRPGDMLDLDVMPGPLQMLTFDDRGDATPIRPQGYTILQANRISDAQRAGVVVRPGVSEITETSFTIGVPGHTYSVINLPTLNSKQLVPGIAITNNLIIAGGQVGITFSGSPGTDIDHAVTFGRIANNTVVDTPTGIQVTNNASPTLVNNIVARTDTAIRVDTTSRTTVVGTTVYQDNGTNLAGGTQTNAIVLASDAPLFVNAAVRNFYLAAGSKAIDSSLDSLPERADMQAVISPLGISPSPILAPNYDILGQLRIDDKSVQSPPGVGSNVFKDRGAVERADFKGPVATLYDPIDNDAALLDRNQAITEVLLVSQPLAQFSIQLGDAGVGVDDSTVTAAKFVIQRTVDGITTTLTPEVDYSIGIENTDSIVLVRPTEGVWANGEYTITIDNSSDPIKDLVGNSLQPNQQSGLTQFTIELTDTPVSSWQNPDNPLDVNADGQVFGLDALLIINRLLLGLAGPLPEIPIVPPYIDTTGDGALSPRDALLVINYLSQPAAAAAAQTASPIATEPADEPLVSELAVSPETSTSPSVEPAASATASSNPATSIAFGITVSPASAESSNIASTSIDVTSASPSEPTATSTLPDAPTATAQAAAADDVWETDEWDPAADEWDGIVAGLFDESEEAKSAGV